MQGKSEGSTLEFTLIDPNGISYPIRLSPADSPIDLKAYLSDFAALSYYTNYQLETDNRVLQDYIELSEQSVSNTVHMVLKPYNDRAFKQHLKRLSDILSHPPSSFSHVIPVAKETSQELDSTPEKVIPAFNMESLVLQPGKILTPPSAWCPFTAEEDSLEIPQCLQSVSLSEYNPPNSKRLIQGDLGYIVARTTEGNVLHITSAVNGFYINATDTAKGLFRPEPTAELITGKTLVELLCNASPSFKTSWNKLITIGCEWNNIRFLSSVLPTPCWIIEKPEEYAKKENLSVRDWNEEFQMIRSLPTETPFQRIQRDKALGKIYSDFLDVAIQGAKAVVIGSVQPLNPMDPMKQQLFVFNHIFFSFTEDLEYVQQQGPEASYTHVSANHDLRSLKLLCSLDIPGLHSIFSVVVDYRGYRVLCQSIIPGILNQNPQTTASYGSIDDGQTIATDPSFNDMMKLICEKVYLDQSTVLDGSGGTHSIWGALDTKGIKGSDQRMYFLEALRMTPRDPNYLGDQYSLCLLRPELIEIYQQLMQNKFIESKMKDIVADKPPEQNKISWEDFQEIVKSYKKITFNPNAFTAVKFADEDEDREKKIKELGRLLIDQQIPSVLKVICADDGCWAKQGNSLSEVLHKFGVNLRYIGKMCELLISEEHRHIKWMLERYAVARSAKHVFNEILRDTSEMYLADVASQLINSLFENSQPKNSDTKKKRKRRKGKKEDVKSGNLIEIKKKDELEPEKIWNMIVRHAELHFGLKIPEKIGFWEAVGSMTLLISLKKELCLQIGLQLDSSSNLSGRISQNNIIGFAVKVKCLDWKSLESRWLYETGMKSISEQNYDVGMEMLIQSAGIQSQISTTLHPEVAAIYQKISQIYFTQNQINKAIKYQHQAILIFEKVLGTDHSQVGNSYINLACYYQTIFKYSRCLKLYQHALQIFMLNHGELCPEVIFILVSLGIMYGDVGMHETSIGILSHVINMCLALYGEKSLFVAEYSHILATEYKILKEFASAQQYELKALEIMKTVLPPEDKRIKDSENFIEDISKHIRDTDVGDKNKVKDPKSYLKQKLNARKLKAKLGIPTHQLHLAYPYVDTRESDIVNARQLTEQLQKRYQNK